MVGGDFVPGDVLSVPFDLLADRHMIRIVTKEFYRSSGWEESDQADFESRLRKALPENRARYLRLKALALAEVGRLDDAQRLLNRVLTDFADQSGEVAGAQEELGNLRWRLGDARGAEAHFRAVLVASPDLNHTSQEAHLAIGEMLLARYPGGPDEIFDLLDAAEPHMFLNRSWFRWYTLAARLADTRDDVEHRVMFARKALELLDADPQFSRHQHLGFATTTPEVRQMLERFLLD